MIVRCRTASTAQVRRPCKLTGERTLPGIAVENYWFRRHEAAYRAIGHWCAVAHVLEIGTGEGYGADLLSATAGRIVALDYDASAVEHLHSAYPGLDVVRGNAVELPFANGALDVVACLQVIEHLWDQPALIGECHRVLRPGGTLLISTPNRLTFPPGNPFHSRELSAAELADLLTPRFAVIGRDGLSHGPRLRGLDRRHGGSLVDAQLAQPPQRWSATLEADVTGVVAADFVISGTGRDGGRAGAIDEALDLLFVAVRS